MKTFVFIGIISLLSLLVTSTSVIVLNPGCKQFYPTGDCAACSVRFYKDAGGICQPVNSNCNDYDTETGACITCYSGFAIVEDTCLPEAIVSALYDPYCNEFKGSTCIKCSQGFYFNEENKCTQADPNCRQFNKGTCFSCYPGFELISNKCISAPKQQMDPNCNTFQDGKCTKCSFGFYFDFQERCQQIPNDCANFSIMEKRCKMCYDGYQLGIDGKCAKAQVKEIDPNCNQFDGSICVKCSYGFYFDFGGLCVKIPDDCAQFSIQQKQCKRCYSGYSLEYGRCVESEEQQGDAHCNQFDSNNVCVKCSFGFYFNDAHICTIIPSDCANFSIKDRRCYQCYSGYELNEFNVCVEAEEELGDPNCREFEGDVCVECSFGFYFNDAYVCTKIPDDCTDFRIQERRCYQCYSGYELNEYNVCVESKSEISDVNCRTFQGDKCVECSFGFYFNYVGVCSKIPDDCLDFRIQQERCFQCYSGYSLNLENKCVKSEQEVSDPHCNIFEGGVCVKCSFGYYFDYQKVCVKIPDECLGFNIELQRCEKCYTGYTLDQYHRCVQSPEEVTDQYCKEYEDGQCAACSTGSFLTEENFCKLVSPLCKTYQEADGKCTGCYPGFTLVDGGCEVAEEEQIDPHCTEFKDGQCVKCSYRFWRNALGACENVDALCDDYDLFDGACLSCYVGFKLYGRKCVEDEQIYGDDNCAQWMDNICVKCSHGSFLSAAGVCELVDLLCQTYDERNGACTSCYPAFKLQGAKCVEDKGFASQDPFCSQFQEGLCVKCSVGFFFGADHLCEKVSDLCQTYDGFSGRCLSCFVGFKLDYDDGMCKKDKQVLTDTNCAEFEKGLCVLCSKGYYFGGDGKCLVANPLCKDFDISNGRCTACYVGFENIDGNCVVKDEQDPRDANCAEWLDEEICLRCADRAVFDADGICTFVSVDCDGYDPIFGSCTSCYSGFDLMGGNCVRSETESACLERNEYNLCVKCSVRSYINHMGECSPVDDQCAVFDYDEKLCKGCYPGYSLLGEKCEITKVEEGKEIENCFAYTPEGSCLECFDHYYLKDGASCEEVDVFCKGYDKYSGDCTSCYEGLGFSLIGGKCIK